jgi:hypothetical protein
MPLYAEVLNDLPADVLADAARAHLRRSPAGKWFPKPCELIELARDAMEHRRWQLADARQDDWPDWLEEIWGPKPEGPKLRNEELRRRREGENA